MKSGKVKTMSDKKPILVSLASGFGTSAIGVIQVVGVEAEGVLQKFFSGRLSSNSGEIQLGNFFDESGRVIDQVLIVKLPVSESIYEITTHGGIRILQRIIRCLERAGAKFVDSRELIDKVYAIDNIVAKEAYRLLPSVKTSLGVKFLLYQAHNGLSLFVDKRDNREVIEQAFEYWPAVKALIDGIKIVITGAPNSGKSTLVNALGKVEHSLVADIAGTTRDYVCVDVLLGDISAELIDTAGIGKSSDIFKERSEDSAYQQICQADIIFVVLDATEPEASKKFIDSFSEITNRTDKVLVLINKIDKRDMVDTDFLPADWSVLKISALKGVNLDRIPDIVWSLAGLEGFDYRKPVIFSDKLALYFSEQTI